jgi:undecaprenyl-diphosphatase
MEWWQATVLAVLEGLTEFLPISSTGHLILAGRILGVVQSEFVKSFEIGIQLGAILAVVGIYLRQLWRKWAVLKRILIAFIPTGLIGLAGYRLLKTYIFGSSELVAVMLILGGGLMIWWEGRKWSENKNSIEELSWKKLLVIGLAQSAAMIPGVSRAMVSIMGGMGVGLTRTVAVETSFLLAVPTMAAATGFDLIKSGVNFSLQEWGILVWGTLVAMGSATLVIRWFLNWVKRRDMKLFAWYRIALGLVWMGIFGWTN